ncbi:hypothetical protein FNV43_RR26378 [Rhamnella rubrinervis]|uniref:Uncharacterized protein n=1 Tax=Rhamnella rubrinervis TaxID=2594499 RepID=A0A8K0DUV8_9ROSA|nr:hypothetical protein FNV43_RR26378 [Rhamnella rubrinervis]
MRPVIIKTDIPSPSNKATCRLGRGSTCRAKFYPPEPLERDRDGWICRDRLQNRARTSTASLTCRREIFHNGVHPPAAFIYIHQLLTLLHGVNIDAWLGQNSGESSGIFRLSNPRGADRRTLFTSIDRSSKCSKVATAFD